MAELTIEDKDLQGLKDKVIIVTGGASGIGLATAILFLKLGAKVVIGDCNSPPSDVKEAEYFPLDVTSWTELSTLFKQTYELHGRIDHVFANAGIGPRVTLLEEVLDEDGELREPDYRTVDINLKSVMNTTTLALHYMKKQESGGSIVVTASASSIQRFTAVDYTIAKHGVLGLVRGLVLLLHPKLPIRINAIAPNWTDTGIVPGDLVKSFGGAVQSPDIVALSTALLMADGSRHGQVIYSTEGRYKEIEGALLASVVDILHESGPSLDDVLRRVRDTHANAMWDRV